MRTIIAHFDDDFSNFLHIAQSLSPFFPKNNILSLNLI